MKEVAQKKEVIRDESGRWMMGKCDESGERIKN